MYVLLFSFEMLCFTQIRFSVALMYAMTVALMYAMTVAAIILSYVRQAR